MKCPCCGKELTVGQELLYRIEDVYYCPRCLVKITGWQDGSRLAKGELELAEVKAEEERLEEAKAKGA